MVNHPDKAAQKGQDNGCDVIDGGANRCTWGNILGVGNLLKIGINGDGKVKKDVI